MRVCGCVFDVAGGIYCHAPDYPIFSFINGNSFYFETVFTYLQSNQMLCCISRYKEIVAKIPNLYMEIHALAHWVISDCLSKFIGRLFNSIYEKNCVWCLKGKKSLVEMNL